MVEQELLTTKEAAAFLRVHMVTLSQWAKQGYVPAMKVGKNWRFARHELTAWLNDPVRRLNLVPTVSQPEPAVRNPSRVGRPTGGASGS